MFLNSLSLVNFKNFHEATLEFSPRINCFAGDNGVGKTNILDAIHYLCLCKSCFNPVDSQNIMHDQEFSVIQGDFLLEGSRNNIYCSIQRNRNKIFKRNNKDYERLAQHIGLLPVVMISPEDSALITEGSDERRKFLNSVISQYNRSYLEDMILYNKLLSQRNKLLKDKHFDRDMLQIYDDRMIEPGIRIHSERLSFVEKLKPVFQSYYTRIAPSQEEVDLRFFSQLTGADFYALLQESREKDKSLQYTTTGIHKDDILLKLNSYPMKKTASQGQQKTFMVALKLAEFDFLKEVSKVKPLLLLDDVFDKFDENRVVQIIKLVINNHFGQIFITHTDKDKMLSILNSMETDFKLYEITRDNIISH